MRRNSQCHRGRWLVLRCTTRPGRSLQVPGQGNGALQAYQGAVAIQEPLARAEPERADVHRGAMVSLVKRATASAPPGRSPLERILAILLDWAGRGTPGPSGSAQDRGLRLPLAGRALICRLSGAAREGLPPAESSGAAGTALAHALSQPRRGVRVGPASTGPRLVCASLAPDWQWLG